MGPRSTLRHRSGVYNAPFSRALLVDDDPNLLHLWRREQGFLVPAGNRRAITSPPDLAGLLVAKRELGAGTRVLLDQLLISEKIAPHQAAGPELHSHLEIALAVASGIADVGLGLRAGVTHVGLEFIPLTWESYDIVLGGSSLGAAQPLITTLRDPTFQNSILRLGGYDLERAGTLQRLGG